MRKAKKIIATVVAVLSIVVSLIYLVLLGLSAFGNLPVRVEPNFLIIDWAFIAVPILALLSAVLLQVASVKKKKKKKQDS